MASQRNGAANEVSAQQGARIAGVELVAALERTYEAYVAKEPDALHDVRVAVRRLRTWLRAFRPVLDDTVGRKSRQGLKRLAETTGEARDAEVAVGMLDQLPAPPPRARTGHADLRRRLERESSGSRTEIDDALAAAIPRLVKRLTRELSHYRLDVPVDGEPRTETMSAFSADVVERSGERLARAMEALEDNDEDELSPPDNETLHATRIAAKRLRYIIELLPVAPPADLVQRLTALQDALGDYHDARLLGERALAEIGRSARKDARERARALLAVADGPPATGRPTRQRVRPGLLHVARVAEVRAHEAWQRVVTDWPRKSGPARLRTDITAFVERIVNVS